MNRCDLADVSSGMKPRLPSGSARIGFLLALATGLASCDGRIDLSPTSGIADRAEIGAVIRQTQEANNAGDVEAWVSLFDQDFRYLGPYAPAVTDRDSLRALARTGFSRWQSEIFIEPTDILVEGDLAIVHSEVRGRAVSRSGPDTVDVDLKQLVVYRRTPMGWRIARLAISPNR